MEIVSGTEIRIEGQPVFLFGDTGYDHLYFVRVDTDGSETVLRGYPSGALGTGDVIFEYSVPIAESADYRPLEDRDLVGSTVLDLGGRSVDAVWHLMNQHARVLEDAQITYGPFLDNSNSAAASLLHVVGIDVSENLPDQRGRTDSYIGTASILDRTGFRLDGTGEDDLIFGARQGDVFAGNDGNDTISGQAGGDDLSGGAGIDFLNGGWGHDNLTGGAGADRFYHAGHAGHGSDWIADFSSEQSDVLLVGTTADASRFQVNFTTTEGRGDNAIEEAFVIWRPTGTILFALSDGGELDEIWLRSENGNFDLLA
ncbi:hypothetical protein [uncultured Sulfitobacter sp.]|uniref:calcium-binding protein n=1 Tax=uncultured Sulfitobacter sp. TaxID=191468 RepID=UPI0026083517|nr:hypothetical protein [uncultured Sulfitobacter sp.]